MPVIKGLEWTFDTVASAYEKFRPGYAYDGFAAGAERVSKNPQAITRKSCWK